MRASGASSGSRNASVASRRATMASTVSSRRSVRGRSVMATHALSQALQRAELELLDGPFGAVESGRHLADALLLDEPHLDHLPLELGQLLDVLIQRDPPVDVLELAWIRHIRGYHLRVAGAFAPVVRERVRGDAEQPGRHRRATPFEASDRAERLLEHLRRDVFGGGPVLGSATDEGIDPVDVPFVNLDKSSRIGLRRLDQKPVVLGGLGQSEPRVSILVTAAMGEKLCSEAGMFASSCLAAFNHSRLLAALPTTSCPMDIARRLVCDLGGRQMASAAGES